MGLHNRGASHSTFDSRDIGKRGVGGTKMKPIQFPAPAIYKGRLGSRQGERDKKRSPPRAIDGGKVRKCAISQKGKNSKGAKGLGDRPIPVEAREEQRRREATHRQVKKEALDFRNLLGNPVFYSPENHEARFPEAAISIAKRGKRSAFGSSIVGSNNTKKAIRNFERGAKMHGEKDLEIERLREYPDAQVAYRGILRRLKARRN